MSSNTARIAKNTLMLYFRQILSMLVSLYTVRVILGVLGAEDYGISSVVSGIVILFTFLNGAMSSATQRFLNFAMGRNDTEQARNIYSISFVIYALIAILVVVLTQTIGLWFFQTWLNIPPERQVAAFVVYQFSVVGTVIGIFRAPYGATIIAHEKMSFFALLSIIEVALRLGVVFLLPIFPFDKLMAYAFLTFITGIVIFVIQKVYCNKMFEIAHFRLCRDKKLFRQLLGFSSWRLFSFVGLVGKNQGINILINIFHGVTVNAAIGIATQVNSAVYQFVVNFQTAFNPQIVKSYSAKDFDYFMNLVFRTAKLSFFLLLFFVLPLYLNADFVLLIWLNNVPEYTVPFTQLLLLSSLMTAIVGPLWMSIQATGDIKKYELIANCFVLANLPLSLFFLWIGFSPVWVLIIRVGLDVLMLVWRVFFLGKKIKLPVVGFFSEVIAPTVIIAGISLFITVFVRNLFINDWSRLIVSGVVSTVSIGFLTYWIGLNRHEKTLLHGLIKKRIFVTRDKNVL